MAEETQYTANTGMQTISTANSNLDGSGTLSSAIITGASNGTLIKTVTIKSIQNTTHGMVRLFIYDGSNTKLAAEIEIPAVTKSATDSAFEITIPVDFALKSGWSLKASTQNAESFNVIAEGLDWAYYASSVRPESTNYTSNLGMTTISTANSNLDGTGALGTILTAASNGTQIQTITIKSQVNTTAGMIRLFLDDGSNKKLLREIPVDAITKSGTVNSFSRIIDFEGKGFALKSGWTLKASTEKAESFNVIAEGLNWAYPA
jgi:hypothetical protein